MNAQELVARLEALEAKNRSLRTLATFALVLAILVPIGAVVGAVAYLKSITPTLALEVRELRAQRYVVVNQQHQSRGSFWARRDDAELRFGSAQGGRVLLRAQADRSMLALAAPQGARTSFWTRQGFAQGVLRDNANHEVQLGVVSSSAEVWRAQLGVRGIDMETSLETTPTSTGLLAAHRNEQTTSRMESRVQVDRTAGSNVALSTWSGDVRMRSAELTAPPIEARTGAALSLEQRGSTLLARAGGVPHIDLRRGATEIWSSPRPRGAEVEEEVVQPAAPAEPAPEAAAPAADP